jgi:hypothetical protein
VKTSPTNLLPKYSYLPRLNVKGHVYLQCPSCALITDNLLSPGQFILQCADQYGAKTGAATCRQSMFGFGFRLFPLPPGRRINPVDVVTVPGLRESFPMGEIHRWKSGEMAHQLVAGGHELVEEFVKSVRGRTAGGLAGLGLAFEQVVAEWGLEPEQGGQR